jgi:polyhydroxyalkanoate synthesis regulator phasin
MSEARDLTLDVEIEEYAAPVRSFVGRTIDLARKSVMVGVGAVDLAVEKAQKGWHNAGSLADDLAERGEKATSQSREQLETQVDKRQEQIKDLGGKANDTFEKYSEAVLTRVHVPTSDDIEDLSKQVSALSRKVDKVRKEQQEAIAA